MARSTLFMVRDNESHLKCRAGLVIRSGKHGPFLECSQYSACDYVRLLKPSAGGRIVKALKRQVCLACGANLMLRQGRFGMFIGCSNYPECEHTELIDKPDETVVTCPQCRTGHLVQRRSRYGKTFYPCDCYPECQSTINFELVAEECPEYRRPLLIEEKTTQGVKHLCVSKQCGKPISAE